ncbi:MAG: hypothetical protein V4566_03160 [Pseudomonadota bacterium]
MLISDLKHGPSETVIAELRDYPEWHRQRQRYGVWVIPVNDPVLLDYIEAARRRLADLLHLSQQRQPHLTLRYPHISRCRINTLRRLRVDRSARMAQSSRRRNHKRAADHARQPSIAEVSWSFTGSHA